MSRWIHFHIGIDHTGDRCWRMRTAAEARRCRERQRLRPKISWPVPAGTGRELWRNGLHRRRWAALAYQIRGDRRCFLTTLKRPPLVPQSLPF